MCKINTVKFNWLKWGSAVLVFPFITFGPYGQWMAKFIAENQTKMELATWSTTIVEILPTILVFSIAVFYWSDGVLGHDWKIWRKHWFKNLMWAILAVLVMEFVILPLTNGISSFLSSGKFNIHPASASALSFSDVFPGIISALISLLAPFFEEIVYHHAITEPFRNKGVWVYTAISIFSNVLFGIVHIHNVNGDWGALVMYIVMGFWFQFVFIKGGRNIWQNIMTHLLYNGVLAMFTIVGSLVVLFLP